MLHRLFSFLLICCAIGGCQSAASNGDDETSAYNTESDTSESGEYEDGTWCADVEYYNPNTGTQNTYQLNVEVEDGELTIIHWPNGGWLDESHFTPEDISDGECSFTSDKGYEYTITLQYLGGCTYSNSYQMLQDIHDDERAVTCPKCGGEKETYDDLCFFCEQKEKQKKEEAETCPVCYGYKNDWEAMCSSCQSKQEEENEDE